jgi:hypothetical protein
VCVVVLCACCVCIRVCVLCVRVVCVLREKCVSEFERVQETRVPVRVLRAYIMSVCVCCVCFVCVRVVLCVRCV